LPVLHRIAHLQNRRDEVPKVELARELAAKKDKPGIREIAENLWNKDKNIQGDCIRVVEERVEDLSGSALRRLKKVLKRAADA